MIALLTPFLIALGIGAGIAAVIVILAAFGVTVRELLTWPATFWRAITAGVRQGIEQDRARQAEKAKKG
jgi:hypothetical protein